MALARRLLIWREENLWSTEPDWRFGAPIRQIIAREFHGPTSARGQVGAIGPKLLKNAAAMSVLAAVPADKIPYRDRDGLRSLLTYLAEGSDLHVEWES